MQISRVACKRRVERFGLTISNAGFTLEKFCPGALSAKTLNQALRSIRIPHNRRILQNAESKISNIDLVLHHERLRCMGPGG
jgi:hypothetical protein